MSSHSGMNPGAAPAAPAIMRIGAARLTAGLDRYPRLDLEAHRDLFGRLPRLSDGDIIAMAQQVDLRGHGGAAFPFARKLKAVVDAAAKKDQPTIVVVNATEGEPGSFKDKMLLMRSPYLILSGAALAAEAIGAEEIVIGVASNELANRSLEAAVAAEPGLRDLVRIVEVPERFISGESGALVRAINGKTPIPPGRKTLAAESGVDGLPTLLSNAETYAQLAVLALLGPERYASVGMPEEPGTVLLSVSGSAARPAVVEVPTGVPLGSVLDICQAPAGDGVLVGGYHGMWLPAENAYVVPVSRSGMEAVGGTLGAGIVLPLGDGTCPLGEVSRIASYLAGESAGQCGPCKLGLPRIARALAAIIDGSGGIEALDVARRSSAAVSGRGSLRAPGRHHPVRAVGPGRVHRGPGRARVPLLLWPPGSRRAAAAHRPRGPGPAAAGRGLDALRGPRPVRPPGAGDRAPGQHRLPGDAGHPGAGLAGEGRPAGGGHVPGPGPAAGQQAGQG